MGLTCIGHGSRKGPRACGRIKKLCRCQRLESGGDETSRDQYFAILQHRGGVIESAGIHWTGGGGPQPRGGIEYFAAVQAVACAENLSAVTKTRPLGRRTALCFSRAVSMLPVEAQVLDSGLYISA